MFYLLSILLDPKKSHRAFCKCTCEHLSKNHKGKENNQTALVVSSLDDIAWSLNIRGRDTQNTPVSISYLVVTLDQTYFYVDEQKLTNEVKDYLSENAITVKNYRWEI